MWFGSILFCQQWGLLRMQALWAKKYTRCKLESCIIKSILIVKYLFYFYLFLWSGFLWSSQRLSYKRKQRFIETRPKGCINIWLSFFAIGATVQLSNLKSLIYNILAWQNVLYCTQRPFEQHEDVGLMVGLWASPGLNFATFQHLALCVF